MERWWESDPARLARELEALDAAGIAYERVGSPPGRLRLNLTWEWDGKPLRLEAHFPTYYPYYPPMVIAPDLDLARHQTPRLQQLCLLSGNGESWLPESDTLASLLQTQLPEVMRSQAETGATGEAHEGVPITGFLKFEANSFVGLPTFDFAALPEAGLLKFAIESFGPFRATIVTILDEHGLELARHDTRDENYFENKGVRIFEGRWVRSDTRIPALDAKQYLDLAIGLRASLQTPRWQTLPHTAKPRIDVVAVLFPDELAWRTYAGNAVVVSRRQELAASNGKSKIVVDMHRVELEDRANHFARDPRPAALQSKTAVLVGTGSVGSPAAKHLAQAGLGNLRLLDHDILDAANSVRWELGRRYAGHYKAFALQDHIEHNYPYCRVTAINARLGDPTLAAGDAVESSIDEFLFRKVDCLVDATASERSMHLLSDQARRLHIPYVWMHATNGGWGGLVGRQTGNPQDLCWHCHLLYLNDPAIIPPLPAAPESDSVQPAGCMDPTFIGAQVDMTEVSLEGARVVLYQLSGVALADGSSAWNLATLHLRDAKGRRHPPRWTCYNLPPHAQCPNH